ncbi:hypothetical protein NX794_30985 [Streptomyces sp. LP11]|uniref:Uncharacterized protein n=1 Tax=Streptomyces pyxinicus TaxID=2970331 RepID=A0ABT2BC20_9ACTN|nr:hypothetical protein [Streptomyces sp. LP11]MCS0605595.1 hypothetical protein [Streptomyces sp. LP11]
MELATTVTAHAYWSSFHGADAVKERMHLKHYAGTEMAVTA